MLQGDQMNNTDCGTRESVPDLKLEDRGQIRDICLVGSFVCHPENVTVPMLPDR